jgi:hypothetical protein
MTGFFSVVLPKSTLCTSNSHRLYFLWGKKWMIFITFYVLQGRSCIYQN